VSSLERAREALGHRLRELREATGDNGKQFAVRLGWDPAKVSRLENGRRAPSLADVTEWAQAAAQPETAEELRVLAAALEEMYTTWRRQFRAGFAARQRKQTGLEDQTREIRAFEHAIIPGLLQTPEYARCVYNKLAELHGPIGDVDESIALRMARQRILYDSSKRLHFVLSAEAVQHSFAPADVMRGQLDRLVSASMLKTVTLGIIPMGREWPIPPSHGFWIFDDTTVLVEAISAELAVTEPDEVQLYVAAFELFAGVSVSGDIARRFLLDLQAKIPD
jgi:transcriptional regulator with XRE-family HTH domain